MAAENSKSADGGTTNDFVAAATPTSVVTVARPVVTLVKYANRAYLHVNGELMGRALTGDETRVAQWALEQVEATGAITIAEQDLRHLTV